MDLLAIAKYIESTCSIYTSRWVKRKEKKVAYNLELLCYHDERRVP